MTKITIHNMDTLKEHQLVELAGLHVSDRQAFQGRSFDESVADWRNGSRENILGLCFAHGGALVGIVLFNRPPKTAGGLAADTASVHGLKIATPWQGQGWGHLAFRLAVQALQDTWPSTKELVLSVDADNTAALAVYRAFGMIEAGPVVVGKHGPEYHLSLSLGP
jgi:RimJ/RimL family protein N-acetyltransferase